MSCFLMFLRIMPMHMQWSFDVIFASSRGCIWSWKYVCNIQVVETRPQTYLLVKICIKYRKHWKSYLSFQLSGRTRPFWAVVKKKWANYEQLLRAIFLCFQGKKKLKILKYIVASTPKSCIISLLLKNIFGSK
jgi:hypothetical protein